MIGTIRTVVTLITLVTSVVVAVVELKKAIDSFKNKKELEEGGGTPAIAQRS
jgi:hypothetical protein